MRLGVNVALVLQGVRNVKDYVKYYIVLLNKDIRLMRGPKLERFKLQVTRYDRIRR